MKNLLFTLVILFCFKTYSQISYEKGYYIDNSNNKIDCLIRNVDWKDNPTKFDYKLSDDTENKILDISNVKEFGIYNESKYLRFNVDIERSNPNFTSTLSENSQPLFNKEELFLKVLIQGKANLYTYSDDNLTKYFYNVDNSQVEQLIFIKYKTSENNIQTNQYYKQQLWLNLKCNGILMNDYNRINFNKNDLVNFFIRYNECNQSKIVNYQEKQKREFFNLTLRPRLNNSAFKIETYNGSSNPLNVDFGNKQSFGFGIETEFILPFNKDKWSLLIEPTFQNFKGKEIYPALNTLITATIDYKSVELPIGVRYYFFLNDKSKIFINGLFNIDFLLKSKIQYTRENGTNLNSFKLNTGNNFALGIGYKHDKYNVELRHQFTRNILQNYIDFNSYYNSSSIILGYTIF
jgi:hypothetical protein